jgi:superfamily I DNA/RNA helicase
MDKVKLSQIQEEVVHQPPTVRSFLEGPAGVGKTTCGVNRLLHLLHQGIPGESILVLTPQRTLAAPYINALQLDVDLSGGLPTCITVGGLARRMIDLFWPQISEQAGFLNPRATPTFLTLETTQYYMAHLVRPLLDQGFFNSVSINRNRLYSQIIDNLNKAAIVGFSHTEIGERLKSAWNGDPAQLRVYDDAQHCASIFREYCLEHNLLDFSLQIEIFTRYIWADEKSHGYLLATYRHILADNIEEDTPIAHDLIREWMDNCASALLIFDLNAGYRRFLGANPDTAHELIQKCEHTFSMTQSFVMSESVQNLSGLLGHKLKRQGEFISSPSKQTRNALQFETKRFFPNMLDWICEQVAELVNNQGISPGEITVLSPFLSDALRFAIQTRLDDLQIPSHSHRPSRALRDEPMTHCLLNLAVLAHPIWYQQTPDLVPNRFDLAYAFMLAFTNLDLVRAQLLTNAVFNFRQGVPTLESFDQLKPDLQDRISYRIGSMYEALREWLINYSEQPGETLDYFLSRLFGEVLSQPGFGFHTNFRAGEITANLIESIQKFRQVAVTSTGTPKTTLGLDYIQMVRDGVIAAQYIRSWEEWPKASVMILPAYTFLMYNRPVDYQFWLDTGSRSWAERLFQPLTQPYVLSRSWNPDNIWTDINEVETSDLALYRLAIGLLHRCRKGIYLGLSNLGEQGYEQRGPLLRAFQRTLHELA